MQKSKLKFFVMMALLVDCIWETNLILVDLLRLLIDIVKKHGGLKASSDVALRTDLIEELAGVLMYYKDVLLCYGISPEELKQAYVEKFEKNMKRW